MPFPFPEDLPNPGMELGSPALQADSYQLSFEGSPHISDSIWCLSLSDLLHLVWSFLGPSIFVHWWRTSFIRLSLENIFFCVLPFYFLGVSFENQFLKIVIKSNLSIFFFYRLSFLYPKKVCDSQGHKNYLQCFLRSTFNNYLEVCFI